MLHDQAPDVRTVLHLGDFNLTSNTPWSSYRRSVTEAMETNGIERILVTPGNHDDWGQLGQRFDLHPDKLYPLPKTQTVAFLPPDTASRLVDGAFCHLGVPLRPTRRSGFRAKTGGATKSQACWTQPALQGGTSRRDAHP